MQRISEDNIREYLTAFADGELDAEQILTVLDHLAEHPEGLQLLRTQQNLRLAADRAVRAATPSLPDQLRRQIEAMTIPGTRMESRPWFRKLGWRFPAIAAAFLLAGFLVGQKLHNSTSSPPRSGEVAETGPPIPATMVAHAARLHADCSRLQEGLHAASYPRELAALNSAVANDFGGRNAYPDLSTIGYQFEGAGPCAEPMAGTAHLLYRSTNPGHKRMLSVFAQSFTGQFALNPGTFYSVAGPRSPFPVYAWRTEKVLYFLIADSQSEIENARNLMTLAIAK